MVKIRQVVKSGSPTVTRTPRPPREPTPMPVIMPPVYRYTPQPKKPRPKTPRKKRATRKRPRVRTRRRRRRKRTRRKSIPPWAIPHR